MNEKNFYNVLTLTSVIRGLRLKWCCDGSYFHMGEQQIMLQTKFARQGVKKILDDFQVGKIPFVREAEVTRPDLVIFSEDEAESIGEVLGAVYAFIFIGGMFLCMAVLSALCLLIRWPSTGFDPVLFFLTIGITGIGLFMLIIAQITCRLFLGFWFGQKKFVRFR